MPWRALICAAAALLLVSAGCGHDGGAGSGHMSPAQMEQRMEGRRAHQAMMRQRARMRYRAMMRQRAHRRAMMARSRHRRRMARHRAEMRQLHAAAAARREEEAAGESSECDPNYAGACLDPAASDYDCAGGSGDGPEYTGPVTVVGEDHYGLDADSDGTGCEPG